MRGVASCCTKVESSQPRSSTDLCRSAQSPGSVKLAISPPDAQEATAATRAAPHDGAAGQRARAVSAEQLNLG
eukprot:2779971-Pleurochrysis_carterae.AAC.1